MAPILKSPTEINEVRQTSKVAGDLLSLLMPYVSPGITTGELDAIANDYLRQHGATSPFFSSHFTICTSINNEVVSGIPSSTRVLHDGDLLKLDAAVKINGWYAQCTITVPVGHPNAQALFLLDVAKQACRAGIAAARPGNHLGDIGYAIQSYTERQGCSVVREYGGYGIGRSLHEDPFVPMFGRAGTGLKLIRGLLFYITAIVTANPTNTQVLRNNDQYSRTLTAVTVDGCLSTRFGYTIAITDNDPDILTRF